MIPESILSFFHASKSLPFRSMTFFNFLLEATLAGSILIVVALILRRVFRRQIGSRLVYLAWLLVAIRLLLPIAIPNPLMDELRPTRSTDAAARPVADQLRVRFQDALSWQAHLLSSAADESGSTFERGLSNLSQEIAAYTSYGWLGKGYLLFYGVGGLIVAAVFTTRHIRFRRKLNMSVVSTLEEEQLALYQDLCKKLNVKQLPVVYADPLPSPCLIGVLRPMIALPLTLPPESLPMALIHELYHYKTMDSWWVLLRCVCCVVHWFNPLVWIAQRLLKADCELACDERVAARLTYDERLHYANILVVSAQQAYAPRAGVLATGMTMTGRRLKWRINAIVRMRAVQRVWATLVTLVLMTLIIAAFSTAESTEQQKRLTADPSAFAFAENDTYSIPESIFGEPVSLSPLRSVAEAEAQAKRYLCALFPEDQDAIENRYRYMILTSSDERIWEIDVRSPETGDTPVYRLSIEISGRLYYATRASLYTNGEELRINTPSILPSNFKSVLLNYAGKVSSVALQNEPFTQIAIYSDRETAQWRSAEVILSNAGDSSSGISLIVQIAPTFCLEGVYNSYKGDTEIADYPPLEPEIHSFVYSKDASIAFGAIYWGQTDSVHMLSPDAVLTAQQAFDIAVEAMLEKSGLSKEAFLDLTLEYGYLDETRLEGVNSTWRFAWFVDDTDANRYWVDFRDSLAPADIYFSMPGQGLG